MILGAFSTKCPAADCSSAAEILAALDAGRWKEPAGVKPFAGVGSSIGGRKRCRDRSEVRRCVGAGRLHNQAHERSSSWL